MIKNWKITCNLCSPLAGEPPMIDALLEYELALRLGFKHSKKMTRNVKLKDVEKVPIPLSKRTISGKDIYCCSNPILGFVYDEWVERHSKRFDTSSISLMLSDKQRKSLLVASGPYKMRFVPARIRLVNNIVWFVRGDRKQINKLLKKIQYLGFRRNIGYGKIESWEYEEQENDYSIFAEHSGKNVLMKTIPMSSTDNLTAYTKGYGGQCPPYWHPDTHGEILKPC